MNEQAWQWAESMAHWLLAWTVVIVAIVVWLRLANVRRASVTVRRTQEKAARRKIAAGGSNDLPDVSGVRDSCRKYSRLKPLPRSSVICGSGFSLESTTDNRA